MAHSIAAKYAARPAARFPTPTARARERRLGLRAGVAFRPTSARVTILRGHLPPLVDRVRASAKGMTWASRAASRPSVRPAPWRA